MYTMYTVYPILGSLLYTRAYGEIPVWGTEPTSSVHASSRKRLYTACSFIRRVGRTVVATCKLTALLRCPESPVRQVKLTKPLILGYPDKILLSIWSLRCYASRRRDTARTIRELC